MMRIKVLPNGCWEWTAAKRQGYGAVRIRAISQQVMQAHRVFYQLVHGRLDAALDLHHKVEEGCIGPSCCNPDHLLPVTKGEHTRDLTPNSISYKFVRRECCDYGHPYTVANTRIVGNATRQCRECDRIKAQSIRDREHPDRPKHAKDPEKFKTHCKMDHLLSGDNIRMVDSPSGPQKRCIACEKLRREKYKNRGIKIQPTRTHCIHGHALEGDNLAFNPEGYPRCRQCSLDVTNRYNATHRERYLEGKKRNRERHKNEGILDNERLRAALPPAVV